MLNTFISGYHSDPEVYITAAKYEFDDQNDIKAARQYFKEGLKYHIDCKSLHLEEFWVEVQHLEKTAGASLSTAIRKYRHLIKRFEGDMEFHFILLDKAIQLSAVRELQCNVVRDMVKNYRHSEYMWQKLAKIHFDGFIYHHKKKQLHYDKNYIRGIRNCIKTYEYGLKENLPPENKLNLWNFYIDHVIEIRKSYRMKKESIKNFMNETMERVFQEAHDNKALRKAEHYIYWAMNTSKDFHMILVEAVGVVKDNAVEIWVKLLSYFVDLDSLEMAIEVFRAGVMALTNKSLPLWQIIILYMQNIDPKLLEHLFKEGARYPYEEINSYIRLQYLEWFAIRNGIFATRELFNELKVLEPECKKLYTFMISLENVQPSSITKPGTLRKLYNDSCNTFGQKDIDVWIDCIRFEYIHSPWSLVKNIYKASLLCLEPELRNAMTEEFEKLSDEFKMDDSLDEGIIVIGDDDD